MTITPKINSSRAARAVVGLLASAAVAGTGVAPATAATTEPARSPYAAATSLMINDAVSDGDGQASGKVRKTKMKIDITVRPTGG